MFCSDSSLDCFLWKDTVDSSNSFLVSVSLRAHSLSFSSKPEISCCNAAFCSVATRSSSSQRTTSCSKPDSSLFRCKRRFVNCAFWILICSSIVSYFCPRDLIFPRWLSSSIISFFPFSMPALHSAIFFWTSARRCSNVTRFSVTAESRSSNCCFSSS